MRRAILITATAAMLALAAIPAIANAASDAEIRTACDVTVPGLTAEQNSAMKATCIEQMTANSQSNPQRIQRALESGSEWGTLAKDLATAIGIAARELGMATNEFLKTPAGLLVAVVLLWQFTSLPGLIFGLLIFVPIMYMLSRIAYHMLMTIWYRERETKIVPVLWGMFTVRKIIYNGRISHWAEGEGVASFLIMGGLAILAIVGLVVIL